MRVLENVFCKNCTAKSVKVKTYKILKGLELKDAYSTILCYDMFYLLRNRQTETLYLFKVNFEEIDLIADALNFLIIVIST